MIMYFVIFMLIPVISTRKTGRIKRNSQQSDYDEYSGDSYNNHNVQDYGMILHDDNNYYDYHGEMGGPCEVDSYQIIIQMGSALFSGTDDKVEIRLYGPNSEISEWLALTEPIIGGIYGFERLSRDTYCVKTEKDFRRITKLGIRKFGTDHMMIETIKISNEQFKSYFFIDTWIENEKQEYIFEMHYTS